MLGVTITFSIFGFLVVMTAVIAFFSYSNLYSADLYAVRAKRAYKNGNVELAVKNYKEAIKRGKYKVSNKAVCLEGLAICYLTLGGLDAAGEYFVLSEQDANATENVFTAHASALLEKSDVRSAYNVLTDGANKHPNSMNISSMLALTAAKLGFFAVADREYIKAKQSGYPYSDKLLCEINFYRGTDSDPEEHGND